MMTPSPVVNALTSAASRQRLADWLCRADKVLLSGSAIVAGGTALFGAGLLGLGLPVSVLGLLIADGVFRPSSGTFYPTISYGPRDARKVALTFDDGPDPQVTPGLLDALAATGARATFFTIGRYLEQHSAIAQRAVSEGHELGNHSWQHDRMQNFYGTRAQAADIDRSTDLIRSLSGCEQAPLYRPPIGLKSPALARAAHARQLKMIAWSLHSRDTMLDARQIAVRVLARVRPGDIVLLHDGHDRGGYHRTATLAAMPSILQGLRERGLQSVTVSELLGRATAAGSASQ